MAHTPGPWFYGIAYEADKGEKPLSYRGPGYYSNAGIISGDTTIVGCDEYDVFGPMNNDEREANVRLICAAPDLLDACLAVLQVMPVSANGIECAVWDSVQAAIKKARGA